MGWKLCAVGDVMLGDHPVCFGHGVRSVADRLGLHRLLGPTRALFESHDYVLGNLESPLSTHVDEKDLLRGEMLGRATFAAELSRAGFDGFSVANNHSLHHGESVFDETVSALRDSNLDVVGLASTSGATPVVKAMPDGSRCAFLGYSLRPEPRNPRQCRYALPDRTRILLDVESASRDVECTVVSLHWGCEYISFPSGYQRALARDLVDAGATVVVGHHPHVLQGVERLGKSLIAYSLGNFCFDTWLPSCRLSAALSVDLSGGCVSSYAVIPLQIKDNFFPEPSPHVYSDGEWLPPVSCDLDEHNYNLLAAAKEKEYSRSSYVYFAKNLHRYSIGVLRASVSRALRRRLAD